MEYELSEYHEREKLGYERIHGEESKQRTEGNRARRVLVQGEQKMKRSKSIFNL